MAMKAGFKFFLKHGSSLCIILVFILCEGSSSLAQTSSLLQKYAEILADHKSVTGIAALALEDGDTVTWNGNGQFPMQSVYKFHLALAVLNEVQQGKLKLDQDIYIRKTDLLPDTWSPIRTKYPEGEVNIPLREVLRYTVSESDNNGCDILFRLMGGPAKVDEFLKGRGYKGISIQATEEEMHKDHKVQCTNWSTPYASAMLLKDFRESRVLSDSLRDFLWKLMVETSTGPKRIKGLLPEGTVVAHKTGSSGSGEDGFTAATNDIGIICLPDGKHIALVVFVSDSWESNEANEALIASIAKATWDYFLAK
jgi:beta-lactamase class A